jgi:ABC-type Na+ efflux pump permease subunit
MRSLLLIAGREFRTYVATLSFWLSLAIAPLGGGIALMLTPGPPAPLLISIQATDGDLRRQAQAALAEAGKLEGRTFAFAKDGAAVTLIARSARLLDMNFSAGFPLSPSGRVLAARTIEREASRRAASPVLEIHESQDAASKGPDVAGLARFATMTMLWLTLTGSLGMLLQAVVRERANCSLETLLAAVAPRQIVAGKILGIGTVSLLVLAVWLGSVFVLSSLQPADAGLAPAILANMARSSLLLRDAAIYVCAFGFYGALTVMLGALARDSAGAQNAARPMFVVLLVAFLAALLSVSRSASLDWLIYLPPFTPFLLLVKSPDSVAFTPQLILLLLMLAGAWGCTLLAERLISAAPGISHIFGRSRLPIQSVG